MGNELIKLKGTGDGVKIFLNENAAFADILNNLHKKLEEFRRFFGNGHCNIYFMGRKLEKSDMIRLKNTVSSMLPESTVHFGENRKAEKDDNKTVEAVFEKTSEFDEIRDVVTTNFKSSRARFYEGLVREGRTVESDGHLVLVGNVEKGAKLVAAGNIIIMGRISGSAEAGCMGNKSAYIISQVFEPEEIKIAGISRRDFESTEKNMQKAIIRDENIVTYTYFMDI